MTKQEMLKQVFELAIPAKKGKRYIVTKVNGYSFNRFKEHVDKMGLSEYGSCLVNIFLPDREWIVLLYRYTPHQWDYILPETWEQEKQLVERFINMRKQGR